MAIGIMKKSHRFDGESEPTGQMRTRHDYVVKGQDYSFWQPEDVQSIIDWGVTNPDAFFGEEGRETRDRLISAGMGDQVIGGVWDTVYDNATPAQRALLLADYGDQFKSSARRQREMESGVSSSIDNAGRNIYNVLDTATAFVPGPLGAINWLGHMGADAAMGRWRKVGIDLGAAAALGAGARVIGNVAGKVRNAFTFGDDLVDLTSMSDRLAVPFSYTPAPGVPAAVPYSIERYPGYMLKSLMEGNPLEKQLSKTGTVNVNNVRALIGKGSKVEQAVVDKVLASEEFAGKKAIDYNKFRKAVQDELITYERTPNENYSAYGMDRLFPDPGGASAGWNGFAEPETFTFSSSRIPSGSGKHYDPNTLGHSRTYTTADEPDVLHVMESQSDWAQGYKKMNLDGEYNQKRINSLERRINNLKESINSELEGLRTEKMNDGSDMSPWFVASLRKQIEKDKQLLEELTVEMDMRRNPKSVTQQDYLAENFTSRQIQENLRYAAEKGQTKMRYPTRETAAKIEGYPKETNYYDADGNLVTDSRKIYTIGKENEKELDLIQRELDGYYAKFNVAQLPNGDYVPAGHYSDNPYQQLIDAIPRKQAAYNGWRAAHPNATSEKGQRIVDDMKRKAEEIKNFRMRVKYLNQRMKELKSIKPYIDPSIKKEVKYMHEDDILRKYNEFPKQFRKLYKNADVRTVTDRMGNTWYEVDVPKNYLEQELAYDVSGTRPTFTTSKARKEDAIQVLSGGTPYNDALSPEELGVLKHVPDHVQEEFINTTLPRMEALRPGYTRGNKTVRDLIMENVDRDYLLAPKSTYEAAGLGRATGTTNSVNRYVTLKDTAKHPAKSLLHELRHSVDFDVRLPKTKEEFSMLESAYGDDFRHLDEVLTNMKGYDFEKDMVTTNRDARAKLLGDIRSRFLPVEEQNAIIDKATKDDIEEALVTSGGYGKAFVELLKKKGLFTEDKIQKIKNAMKVVGGFAGAGYAGSLLQYPEDYAKGGKIHIKPSHRGRLTELKKRTGKSEAELYNDGNPAHKKMVVFARNARKWKHEDGGPLDKLAEYSPEDILMAIRKIRDTKG